MRHSGASWDRLQQRRDLNEIQKRGQWKSHASVARYEKATKVMSGYSRLPLELRDYMETVSRNLEQYFLNGWEVPLYKPGPSAREAARAGGALKRGRRLG